MCKTQNFYNFYNLFSKTATFTQSLSYTPTVYFLLSSLQYKSNFCIFRDEIL